jgi:hypothetical protein
MGRLQSVIFYAFLLASLTAVGLAEAKTTKATKSKVGGAAATAQAAGGTHKNAMAECEAQYGGQRFFLGRDRYAYIEQCFKSLTGMYPHQASMNCSVKGC